MSPSFDEETAKICNLYQVPYLPGCMTITEMKEALKSGADIIKLFPGSVYGPSVISAFKAPLPQLNIMPTGGVSLENMAEWFDACDGRRCWWQSVSASKELGILKSS